MNGVDIIVRGNKNSIENAKHLSEGFLRPSMTDGTLQEYSGQIKSFSYVTEGLHTASTDAESSWWWKTILNNQARTSSTSTSIIAVSPSSMIDENMMY